MKYSQEFIISTGDVDFKNRLKPSAMLVILQEIATVHANILGIGYDDIGAQNLFWVLAQMIVRLEKTPVLHQKIIVETWPVKPRLINTEREFLVRDTSGNILIRATSRWCLLDKNTRNICRLSNGIIECFADAPTERACPDIINQKIEPVTDGLTLYSCTTRAGDIDVNLHVNNTKYADFFFDVFSVEDLNKDIKKFNICYLNETRIGENFDIIGKRDGGAYIMEMRTENGLKTNCRCRIDF